MRYWLGVLLLFSTLSLGAQESTFPEPLSARTANYDISVVLDTENKMLHASETVFWKNPSENAVPDIQFHLYLNAFRNTNSTFYQDPNRFFDQPELNDEDWSWINIDEIRDEAGNDLTEFLSFIHPDDDNALDRTVAQLLLPEPVQPGETKKLYLKWSSKLHKLNVRTGYEKDFYHNVQWFPKTGVYEPAGSRFSEEGGWNCHQYHASTEYFGEYGNYNVDITVPKDFLVGASGTLYKQEDLGEQQRWFFHAEDVIDFAWTASNDLILVEEQWNDVTIKLLISPEYECCTDRYIESAKHGLDYLGEHLMPYPWPYLTIVVPPFYAANAGAMEYPTLITAPGMYKFPTWLRSPEYFVIHEFVHQYFHLMVGTNEFEEPWMDEGFTSYWKSRVLDHAYGEKKSLVDLGYANIGTMEFFRSRYTGMGNLKIAESSRFGFDYKNDRSRALFYSKPATWLRTLEGLVGVDMMNEIMHTYFHRWKFKHPNRNDFIAVVNEVVAKHPDQRLGGNLDWFFEQVLFGTGDCDYALAEIVNKQLAKNAIGIFEEKGTKAARQAIPENQNQDYHNKVIVHRLGDIMVPQEVLVKFDDGSEVLEKWDGKTRVHTVEYRGNKQVTAAQIDPEEKIYLDKNFLNNSYRVEPANQSIWKYVSQFFMRVQNALQGLNFLV